MTFALLLLNFSFYKWKAYMSQWNFNLSKSLQSTGLERRGMLHCRFKPQIREGSNDREISVNVISSFLPLKKGRKSLPLLQSPIPPTGVMYLWHTTFRLSHLGQQPMF